MLKLAILSVLVVAISASVIQVQPKDEMTKSSSASSSEEIEAFCAGRKDGNYRNWFDCESYIACSNGRSYVMDCPMGHGGVRLHWDWHSRQSPQWCPGQYDGQCLGRCTYPAKASCRAIASSESGDDSEEEKKH